MKKQKKLLSVMLFIVLLGGFLFRLFGVLNIKSVDGVYSLTKLYEAEDETIDVIFLGSSHMYENINTQVLWDNYGMAAFDLGGSVQPPWNTYFYLKEAFKTQKPKLVVYDAFTVTMNRKYSEPSRAMKNTFGMKWSLDKLKAIRVSYEYDSVWDLLPYIFEYPAVHSRYTDLVEGDFTNQARDYTDLKESRFACEDWKGFYMNLATKPRKAPDIRQPEERQALDAKQELYFRKIIELCEEHEVPLLLIVSPYHVNDNEMMRYLTIQDIAEDAGLDFINFNLLAEELGLDFSADFADNSHLNYLGSQKYTTYLGDYITSQYEIPNHLGDERYADYDRMAKWYRDEIAAFEAAQ